MLPAERRHMRDEMLPGRQCSQGVLKIFRVPKDDGCDQQIEAGGPKELVLEAAVAQLAEAVKEDGPRQRVAGLALVEAGMGPPALCGISRYAGTKSSASTPKRILRRV